MKTIIIFLIVFANIALVAQPQFELSRNIYRSPYINGQEYRVSQDIVTHSPQGALDLRATGADDCDSHQIVAAAAGTVRNVVENNNVSGPGNAAFNNYVWIQHANGEWTKYTHFKQNSVVVTVGQVVCAGEVLGLECDIGAVSPANFRHLHFECRLPVDPINPPISAAGGFMDSSEPRLIPVIGDITNNYYTQGDINTAANSGCSNANESFVLLSVGNGEIEVSLASTSVSASSAVTFSNGSNGFFRAGNNVTLSPGFTASAGTYFSATVGSCGTTPWPGGCN
ncbi:MAG: peptidoglycan DD-metalloendopeptidase family protein [Bacteroidota bacterium]